MALLELSVAERLPTVLQLDNQEDGAMLDIVVLFMRVTNSTWPADDIVDVFPIAQDPGPGVAVHPKHALMVIRNAPVDSFARVKELLTQINLLDDDDSSKGTFDKRRWFFRVADLSVARRNFLINDGRLDIDWADVSPVCIRKQQGVTDERPIDAVTDLPVTD